MTPELGIKEAEAPEERGKGMWRKWNYTKEVMTGAVGGAVSGCRVTECGPRGRRICPRRPRACAAQKGDLSEQGAGHVLDPPSPQW